MCCRNPDHFVIFFMYVGIYQTTLDWILTAMKAADPKPRPTDRPRPWTTWRSDWCPPHHRRPSDRTAANGLRTRCPCRDAHLDRSGADSHAAPRPRSSRRRWQQQLQQRYRRQPQRQSTFFAMMTVRSASRRRYSSCCSASSGWAASLSCRSRASSTPPLRRCPQRTASWVTSLGT